MYTLGTRDATVELPEELRYPAANLRWRWPNLPPPLALPWCDELVVTLDNRGTLWLYGPVERDPILGPHGPAVLPRRERRRLEKYVETGPRFDAVTAAHELDPDRCAAVRQPVQEHGPHCCSTETARRLVGDVPAHPGVARAARLLDAVAGGAAAAAGALNVLLDPVVFGVVAPSGLVKGAQCLCYPIAVWRW